MIHPMKRPWVTTVEDWTVRVIAFIVAMLFALAVAVLLVGLT